MRLFLQQVEDEAKRRVEVYNMKCSQQVTFETDFSFEDAQFLSNHEVCLTSENACALYTLGGREKFYYEFENRLCAVTHVSGYRRYAFVLEGTRTGAFETVRWKEKQEISNHELVILDCGGNYRIFCNPRMEQRSARDLYSLISVVLLIGLISYATPYVTSYIKENTGVYTILQERCTQALKNRGESSIEEKTSEQSGNTEVAGVSLPEHVTSYITDSGNALLDQTGVYDMLGSKLADWILAGISYFIALIAAGIIVIVNWQSASDREPDSCNQRDQSDAWNICRWFSGTASDLAALFATYFICGNRYWKNVY